MKFLISILLLLVLFSRFSHGFICKQKGLFGITTTFSCPRESDPIDAVFCCELEDSKYCCPSPFDEKDLQEIVAKMPTILGVIFAIVIGSIICCIICCCCCPCCLLHKRRTRGAIHNPSPGAPSYYYPNATSAQPVTLMTTAPPGQMAYAPVQNAPYPQPGYAQPPQAYPPPAAAPYPVPGDNPPPYGDKQMPFNPNY